MLISVYSHFSAPKYARARLNIGQEEGAHLSENKGVKSECKKVGKNSRQMAPASTICDVYCIVAMLKGVPIFNGISIHEWK